MPKESREIPFLTRLELVAVKTPSEEMLTSRCSTEIMFGILTMRSRQRKRISELKFATDRLSVVETISKVLISLSSRVLLRTSKRTREKNLS